MSLLEGVLSGVLASLALAVISGFFHMVVKQRFERPPAPSSSPSPQDRSFMEVWECPHCRRLSRIARQCKWCMKDMPARPRLLTVPEKEYTEQLLLPGPVIRRNPASDDSLPA